MSQVVQNGSCADFLRKKLNQSLTLKLYSNNVTPAKGDTAGSYTEVSGGGYVAKTLLYAGWTITTANPAVAQYAAQDFSFTGTTDAPGTIYGYFIVDSLGAIVNSERFDPALLPFSPTAGALIRVTPLIEAA